MMPQWFFKITAYAERLLADLDTIDWSDGIKAMQRNWIGRSEGAEVEFQTYPASFLGTPPETGREGLVISTEARNERSGEISHYSRLKDLEDSHIDELLHILAETRSQELNLSAGKRPIYRKNDRLEEMQFVELKSADTERMLYDILSDDQIKQIENQGNVEFSYALQKKAKFDVKAKRENDEVSATFELTWSELSSNTPPSPIPMGEGPAVRPSIRVFTTRPDTLWGATFMVLAPEHPLVDQITTPEHRGNVQDYIQRTQRETEIERQAEGKEKTGVLTGAYAINPVNGERIPIWIADYVLMGYGTGAIMAVPAHDQRDFEFARKFGLPIVPVYQEDPENPITGEKMTEAIVGSGVLTNSGPFDGLAVFEGDCRQSGALARRLKAPASRSSPIGCATG